jgi:ribosome biogenesis GTPase / thiamine phosphate phosphatase
MAARKRRADFRKKYQGRVRRGDLTRDFKIGDAENLADAVQGERLSGKGDLTRKRTVASQQDGEAKFDGLLRGRVISVHGLRVKVLSDDGRIYQCAVRQVLKSLSIDGRTAVVAGDEVRFRADSEIDGMIEHVQPRRGVISRTSRGQQHILAANIDYLLIIVSLAQPGIKPALIDRFLLTAAQCDVVPIIVLNKADLIDPVGFQPLMGNYASMGYRILMTSAQSGLNVEYLRHLLVGKQTVLAGQSGVGKSSLLNAIEPGLGLAVGEVSLDNEKGRHTTTAARLIPLIGGGAVFDTPGIRQFQLWDIAAAEVAGLMPDFLPYVSGCRYPNCLHLTEDQCAVKNAVADGRISDRRYDAYCHLLENDLLVEDR